MRGKGTGILKKTALILSVVIIASAFFGCCAAEEGNGLARLMSTGISRMLSTAKQKLEQPPAYRSERAKWTVMLYICGADLESEWGLASENLAELCSVAVPEEVNILVETGGAYEWSNPFVEPDALGRFIVRSGALQLLDIQPSASMGEAGTLGDFIAWSQWNFPAERYMLLLWDHGGGSVGGVCFDEVYYNDSLDLNELGEGLSMAEEPFELIGFDACLMATLETAETASPYAKYMVASEEIVPGRGWSYDALAEYISENPDCEGEELGRVICDSYYSKCRVTNDEDMVTLSLIELDKIPELSRCFSGMAGEMTGVTGDIDSYRLLVQAVGRTENYGGNSESEGYTNMVDLGDLAVNARSVLPQTGSALLEALFDAVVYQVKGANRTDANGLAVYYPLSRDTYELDMYSEISRCANYMKYLENMIPEWDAPDWADDSADAPDVEPVSLRDEYRVEFETWFTDENYLLDVTNGAQAVESVQFALYYIDYDYNEYMLMGYDNDLFHDWENMRFCDNVRGVWPAINGLFCSPTLIAEAERYNIYSIPILLNGEQTNIRAAYIWNADGSGYFKILGIWDGLDDSTGMSARGMRKLKMGDEITPLILGINIDTGENIYYEYGSFIYEGEAVISEEPLDDGDYSYIYMVHDVFGNVFSSEEAILEIRGDNMRIYQP